MRQIIIYNMLSIQKPIFLDLRACWSERKWDGKYGLVFCKFVVSQMFDCQCHRLVTLVQPTNHISFFLMPPGQKSRDDKVIQTIQAIKNCGDYTSHQELWLALHKPVCQGLLQVNWSCPKSSLSTGFWIWSWANYDCMDEKCPLRRCQTGVESCYHTKSCWNNGQGIHKGLPQWLPLLICIRTYCRLCGHQLWAWEDQEHLQHIVALSYPPSQHSSKGSEWLWKEERCREDW